MFRNEDVQEYRACVGNEPCERTARFRPTVDGVVPHIQHFGSWMGPDGLICAMCAVLRSHGMRVADKLGA